MHETLKWIWTLLFVIFIIGMISLLPYEKYQAVYFNELYRMRSIPQERIDATYRYIEAVENGWEDTANGILTEPPRKYYSDLTPEQPNQSPRTGKKYSKPLYVRDKNNPNIWHRCKD